MDKKNSQISDKKEFEARTGLAYSHSLYLLLLK